MRQNEQSFDYEFAILGAGAIGTIIAAHLARAGHRVAVLARGRRAAQLREQGLRVEGLAQIETRADVIDDPARLASAGVFMVATKTTGTADALATYRHARFGTVLSFQNGVLKEELLINAFGADRTLGALADTSGELQPSGSVLFTRNVALIVGELAGGVSPRAQRLAGTIDATGLRAAAVPDVLSLEWSKFVAWAPLIIVSVLSRAETWRFLKDHDTAWLFVRIMREMGALAEAMRIPLTDRAMIPVQSLLGIDEAAAIARLQQTGNAYEANAPHHRMSGLQDVDAGRTLEVEDTIGYAVRKAESLSVAMPLTSALYRLVAATGRISAARAVEALDDKVGVV